jgi:hypothetical protein
MPIGLYKMAFLFFGITTHTTCFHSCGCMLWLSIELKRRGSILGEAS